MTDYNQRMIGRILSVHKSGWGFISSREIEFTRIFFHWTALKQDTISFPKLRIGMQVEFTPLEIPGRGWRALHIKVLERPKENEITTDMPALSE